MSWAGSIFFPSERAGTPPLDLSVAEYLGSAGQWEKAAEEYERVAEWHPTARRVWVGWMEVAGHLSNCEAETQQVLAEGLHALKSDSDREALYAAFAKARGDQGGSAA